MRTALLFLASASLIALTACKDGNLGNTFDSQDTGDPLVGAPNLLLDVRDIDFGTTDDINQVVQAQLVLQNNGQGPLEITAFTTAAPFQVNYTAITIQPQASVQATVSFLPTTYDDAVGTLTITSNDPDEPTIEVSLAGYVLTDRDGDGHDRPEAGGDDCDDEHDTVYPGAREVWYNGRDENCDGLDDYDQDQDGFRTSVHEPDVEDGGGDCNDVNADIFPGAADTWYDGVDSNCGGEEDYDQDQDGYESADFGRGNDCNDYDPEAYPGSAERLNGTLDNCSGEQDREVLPSTANYVYYGNAASATAGTSVAVGDLDSDGIDDLLVGASGYTSGQGAVAIYLSGAGWPASGSDIIDGFDLIAGAGTTDRLGSTVHVFDDFDLDGDPDVVMGAYGTSSNYGAIYLINASDLASGAASLNDAHTSVRGTSSHYYVGRSLARGDIDGDGADDLFFDYSPSSSTGSNYDYLGLLYGGTARGQVNANAVDARWTTSNQLTASYEGISDAADLNGDGYEDFAFGDTLYDYSGTNTGGVWVLWGRSPNYVSAAAAFTGQASLKSHGNQLDRVGMIVSTLPDRNGDGMGELAYWVMDEGDVAVIFGSEDMATSGVVDVDNVDLTVDFTSSYDATVIRPLGDWDGDSLLDWGVGIDGDGAATPGQIFIISGASVGVVDTDTVIGQVQATIDESNTYFSYAVSQRAGDLDGDGTLDLVASDPGFSGDGTGDGTDDTNIGGAYTFLNMGN